MAIQGFSLFRWAWQGFGRLRKSISGVIEEFFEGLPEMLMHMGEGYSTRENNDPRRSHEKLLRRFIANDIRLFGKNCRYRIHNLLMLARFYRNHQLFIQAAGQYDRAFDIVRLLEKGERRCDELLEIGDFYFFYAQYERSRECYQLAIELLDDTLIPGNRSAERLDVKERLARVFAANEACADAVDIYLDIIDSIMKEKGPSCSEIEKPLRQLLSLLRRVNREQELEYYEKLLQLSLNVQILESCSEDSIYLCSDLAALAAHLRKGAKYDLAQTLEARAEFIRLYHKVRSDVLPKMHEVEKVCDWLKARSKGGDGTVAFRLHRHAVHLHEKAAEKIKNR